MSKFWCVFLIFSCAFQLKSALGFSLIVTGDVNLNPKLKSRDPKFIWGDTLPFLLSADLLAINHESTLAGIPNNNPHTIQFEDPLNYTATYGPQGANVGFLVAANNHQNDFGDAGLLRSVDAMNQLGIPWAGLSKTMEHAMKPRVVTVGHQRVAFFTMVVDECYRWPNGTLYLDHCTCGENAGAPPPYQCYAAGDPLVPYGMYYHWGITDDFIMSATENIKRFRESNPEMTIVVYLHAGPNFEWQPTPLRTQLLRNISTVSDLVWCTSSHHIQKFEVFQGTPIIYGLGDFLFRHVVGVSDFCPINSIPCQAYRPDLALTYSFTINSKGRVLVNETLVMVSRHDDWQTHVARDPRDLLWVQNIFNELSVTATLKPSATTGYFSINAM